MIFNNSKDGILRATVKTSCRVGSAELESIVIEIMCDAPATKITKKKLIERLRDILEDRGRYGLEAITEEYDEPKNKEIKEIKEKAPTIVRKFFPNAYRIPQSLLLLQKIKRRKNRREI